MKKRITFLLLLCIWSVGAFAQLPTNAQGYEKSFWQYIEKLKATDPVAAKGAYQNAVTQAQTNLNQLKKYAPDYNVSNHESALKPHLEAMEAANSAQRLAAEKERVESFLEKIGKLPVGYQRNSPIISAARSIENIKKQFPSFDATGYEKQLADYEAAQAADNPTANAGATGSPSNQGGSAPSTGGGAAQPAFESEYWTTFKGRSSTVTWKEDATYSDQEIATAENKCAGNRDKYNAFANGSVGQFGKTLTADPATSMLKTALEDAAFVTKKVDKIKSDMSVDDTRGRAVRNYFELLQLSDYWNAQAKIFPQSAPIQDAAQKINALRAELGDVKAMINKAAGVREVEIENTTMPAAVRRDAGLEAEFKAILLNTGWAKEVTKVNLTQSDWQINRNAATGKILNRSQVANIVTPGEGSKCIVHVVSITQDYNGSSYGKSHLTNLSDMKYMILCSNVK